MWRPLVNVWGEQARKMSAQVRHLKALAHMKSRQALDADGDDDVGGHNIEHILKHGDHDAIIAHHKDQIHALEEDSFYNQKYAPDPNRLKENNHLITMYRDAIDAHKEAQKVEHHEALGENPQHSPLQQSETAQQATQHALEQTKGLEKGFKDTMTDRIKRGYLTTLRKHLTEPAAEQAHLRQYPDTPRDAVEEHSKLAQTHQEILGALRSQDRDTANKLKWERWGHNNKARVKELSERLGKIRGAMKAHQEAIYAHHRAAEAHGQTLNQEGFWVPLVLGANRW